MSLTRNLKRTVIVAVAMNVALVGGCASVRDRATNLWPFGKDRDAAAVAEDNARVSVLALEEALTKDPALESTPVTIPVAQALTSWPSPGGLLTNAPQNVAGDGPLAIVWRRKVGDGAGRRGALTAVPIVAEGRIYVLDGRSNVVAVDQATGRQVWKRSLVPTGQVRGRFLRRENPSALGGGLAYGEGNIYAGTGFGNLIALNAATGADVWRMDAGSPIHAAPLSGGGRVYVTSNDSELFAVEAATGKVQWTQSAIAEPARMLSSPSPALVGETVVAPFASGEVIAYLAANGRRLWSEALTRAGTLNSLSTINDIATRPAVVNGIVYAASQSGTLAAIELRTGGRVWEKPIASIQTPLVAGAFVYAVSTTGELVALDGVSGGVKWTRQLPAYRNERKKKDLIAWTGPVMIGGRLVLASSDGRIEVVRPEDGTTILTRNAKSPIFIAPAIADGTLFFLTNEGELIAVR